MNALFAEHFLKGCLFKFAFEDSSSQGKERKYMQLQFPIGQCFALRVDNFAIGTLGLHLLGAKKIWGVSCFRVSPKCLGMRVWRWSVVRLPWHEVVWRHSELVNMLETEEGEWPELRSARLQCALLIRCCINGTSMWCTRNRRQQTDKEQEAGDTL